MKTIIASIIAISMFGCDNSVQTIQNTQPIKQETVFDKCISRFISAGACYNWVEQTNDTNPDVCQKCIDKCEIDYSEKYHKYLSHRPIDIKSNEKCNNECDNKPECKQVKIYNTYEQCVQSLYPRCHNIENDCKGNRHWHGQWKKQDPICD